MGVSNVFLPLLKGTVRSYSSNAPETKQKRTRFGIMTQSLSTSFSTVSGPLDRRTGTEMVKLQISPHTAATQGF